MSWRATLRDPTVAAIALYALVSIAAMIAAYFAIFTMFVPYDDEGTLLVTLKAFLHGGTLYRDIYSEYGPFYYEVFGGLFALTGHAVTTDASRSIVIVVWVAASLAFGLAAHRLTGRLLLGVGGMIVAFADLHTLIGEPMHPHGLAILSLALFTLLVVLVTAKRATWIGACCGGLLAAVMMTKLNLGLFAVAAVALAAVLTLESLSRRRWLRWLVAVAFLAMPIVVMDRDLGAGWVRDLIVLEILAASAVIVAAWPHSGARDEADHALRRWLTMATGGFVLSIAAILVAIFLTGATPSDLYDGMIIQALRVRDVLVNPFPFPPAAVDWGVAALAVATLTTRLRRGPARTTIWPGLLRAIAGLAIWYVVASVTPLSLNPSAGNPDTLPMVLAWVAVVPPVGVVESSYKRFLRVLLPALAVAETLQVYPVAGSQMSIAAVTFVAVGALCLGDAITCLRSWSEEHGTVALERIGAVVGIATVALAGQLALDAILRPAANNAVAYRHQRALPFPGATLLHIPAGEVETYERLVGLLHQHRCTAFVGYPNIDSLYLWSGIEAPPPAAPGAWIKALEGSQQQRVVNELRASPRPCAIRSYTRAEMWLHGSPPPNLPLVRYVMNDFAPVAKVGEFEFMLPKPPIEEPSATGGR